LAELTLDPAETVRVRLERALAAEEVNLASEAGRARTEQLIEETLRSYEAEALSGQAPPLDAEQRTAIAAELRNELVGLGSIAERMLADPLAQEWMINGPRRLFRDTGERLERVPDFAFDDDRQVRAFVERLLEQVEGKRLDRITPRVEARLPDGSRLTAAIPPVSSNGHTICSIRRFRLAAGTLDDLVDLGFLSEQAAAFLAACVRAGKNIVVAGRVSSGKTTLLNALGRAISGTERVVVCESSAELQLPQILPNCVGYEARPASNDGLPAVTLEDLVSDALRMNPDRILVGECRGPETMAMLWSFATGHAGMTSVHGESAEHALQNLVRFALTSGARIEAEQALDWLREVDLVVHCDRPRSFRAGERRFLPRRIDEIAEVAGVEGNRLTLNPLFDGAGPQLRWLASAPAYLDELEQAGFHVRQ
jgi:pilus assembly protein CpaF